MPDLAAYLQRLSFLLRQGQPVADVALYAPTEDAWSTFRPGVSLNLFRKIVDLVGPDVVPAIIDAGHAFDLVDDGLLAEMKAKPYRAVVLPGIRLVPEATRRALVEYARSGATLIAVRRTPEGEWPGLEMVAETELAGRLAAAVPPDVVVEPATPEIGFVHRRLADADVYFLANTGNVGRQVRVRFREATTNMEMWDPLTGGVQTLEMQQDGVTLQFEPYSSRVMVFRKAKGGAAPAPQTSVVASEELPSGWTVAFGDATTAKPVDLPHSWADDMTRRYFSGTASYRRTVRLPAAFQVKGTRVFLDFGDTTPSQPEPLPGGTLRGNSFAALAAPPVREAATVFVNGRRAGAVWAPPFRVEITPLLRSGPNELRVDVSNTAINRLAEGGHLPDMAPLVERYGQRTRLQDLEGLRPLPSGILSVPRLVAER